MNSSNPARSTGEFEAKVRAIGRPYHREFSGSVSNQAGLDLGDRYFLLVETVVVRTRVPATVYLLARKTYGGRVMPDTWFITGAARGLGREIALRALNEGANVVASARNPAQIEEAFAGLTGFTERGLSVALDVTDETQAATAVEKAIERFGRIDYLVNNAGRGLLSAVEEASTAEVAAVFATNVFGLLHVTRAVLPHMRMARSGHVVNISSMGGFAQVPGWGVYGATKFAVEGLSEALSAELSPLGIHVTVVEPGSFRTDFLDGSSLQTSAAEISDYAETVGKVRWAAAANNHGQMNDPAKGAAAIYSAVTDLNPPTRLQIGPDAIAMVESKLAHVRDELDTWRDLGSSTLFTADGGSQSA
jgi:NAD(P)-dependent dehydrogenase (short-subunit alcohol dehydrogenase family)